MKFRWPIAVILISNLSCCNKSRSPEPAAAATTEVKAQVEPPKAAAPPVASIDPKVASSVLRVRVATGGMTPADFPAVLLHPLEASGTQPLGNLRFVVTLLSGYDEPQLRNAGCKILVHRNKFNESGTKSGVGFPAWLVRMDATSKMALVGYVDEFPYADDTGLRIENKPDGLPITVIRTYLDSTLGIGEGSYTHIFEGPDHGKQTVQRWATFGMEAGVCPNMEPGGNLLHLPERKAQNVMNETLLIIANDKIVGFAATEAANQARLVPIGKFDCIARLPSVAPVSAKFDTKGALQVEAEFDPAGSLASELHLLSTEVPSETFYFEHFKPGAGNQPAQPPHFRSNYTAPLPAKTNGPGTAHAVFFPAVPSSVGEEKMYVLNLGLLCKGQPMIFGQPWLLKLSRQPDGVYPTIVGLTAAASKSGLKKETSPPAAAPPRERHTVPDQTYLLEGSVRQIRPIKNGRELLFQFDAAPYWKRFSLEKNSWLPLPELDLSKVQVAGNQESLFVLSPSSHEVRRYQGDTLQLKATAHLPAGNDHFTVLAGSCSSNAPVFVLFPHGVSALSPHDLNRLDVPLFEGTLEFYNRKYSPQDIYETSGDGKSIWTAQGRLETYNDDFHGLQPNYFSLWHHAPDTPCGISGAFQCYQSLLRSFTTPLSEGAKPPSLSFDVPNGSQPVIGLDASCPILFQLQRGNAKAIPPVPTQLAFCSLFDTTPFLEVETPELASIVDAGHFRSGQYDAFHQRRCVFLEPESLHLGILAPDRKTWTVRHVASLVKAQQPVLLNWPETSLHPGEKTRYSPRILGGYQFQADMMNRPKAVSFSNDKKNIEIQISPDEFASISVLRLKLLQSQGDGPTCQIPITLTGIARPILAPVDLNETKLKALNAEMAPTDLEPVYVRGIGSRVLVSQDAIINILGTVDGFAILQLESNRVQFLSLESGAITHTLPLVPDARFFVGAGAVYEFNKSGKTFSRIDVPSGSRGNVFPIPDGLILKAVGIGRDRDSPLTLLIEGTTDLKVGKIGDVIITDRKFSRNFLILDNQLNRNLTWSQPVSQEQIIHPENGAPKRNPLYFALSDKEVIQLATSYDGRVIPLPQSFHVIGSKFSTSFESGTQEDYFLYTHATALQPVSGSMSGIISAAPLGECFKAGKKVAYEEGGSSGNAVNSFVDPSGRYRWIELREASSTKKMGMSLRLVETNKLMAKLIRLPILEGTPSKHQPSKRVYLLSENGLMALLNATGRVLQLVDFNYQNAFKVVAEDDVHVVSQPQFYVSEGHTLEYQVRVSNPELVQDYRLQAPVEGALLDEKGLLRYAPPAEVKAPAKVNFTIEVKSKSGAVFIHEFPVQILALPKNAPPKVSPPAKVSI